MDAISKQDVFGVRMRLERPLVSVNGPGDVSQTRLGSQAQAEAYRFMGLVHVLSSSTLSTVYRKQPSQKHLKQTFSLKLFLKFQNTAWSGSR